MFAGFPGDTRVLFAGFPGDTRSSHRDVFVPLGTFLNRVEHEHEQIPHGPPLWPMLGHFAAGAGANFSGNLGDAIGGEDVMSWYEDAMSLWNAVQELQVEGDVGESASAVPTGEAALASLPKIKVTDYDLKQNQNEACVICLENFVLGEAATRLPCGHLFHESCVKQWLGNSNQCPTCRYELPTDNTQYESGRRERMAGRRPRLSRQDLAVKTVRELRRLAEHLDVDTSGCLEKEELVERIVYSGKVTIVPDAEDTYLRPEAVGTKRKWTAQELSGMSAKELKAEMAKNGIHAEGCIEKADLLQRFHESDRVSDCDADMENETACRACPSASPTSSTSSSAARHSSSNGSIISDIEHENAPAVTARLSSARPALAAQEGQGDLKSYSVAELRKVAVHLGVSLDGCLEKKEMIERIGSVLGRPEETDPMQGPDCLDSLMSPGGNGSAGGVEPATTGAHTMQASPSRGPSAASPVLRPHSPFFLQAGSTLAQQ